MRRELLVLCALVVVIWLPCSPVLAEWSHDPMQNTPVCVQAAEQGFPALAPDIEGGVFVIWEDRRDSGYSIYGHHILGNGDLHEGPGWPVPMCEVGSYQLSPTAVADDANGCFALWCDERSGNWQVFAQHVDFNGTYLMDPFGMAVCPDTSGQVNFRAVSDGDGGVIVAWSDYRAGEDNWNIYAQRINRWNSLVWPSSGVAVCTATGHQRILGMAEDGAGGALIAWTDERAAPNSLDIYVQRIDPEGVTRWTSNGVAVCMAPNWQTGGGVASDGAGGAVVTWRDERTGGTDVYAQRVSGLGSVSWAADGVPVQATGYDEYGPSIIDDGDAGVIVAWLDGRAGGREIYAQRLDRWGGPLWDVGGVPVCTAGNYVEAPELISDGAGGVIVSWRDYRGVSDESDVYAQRLDAGGSPVWQLDGVAISTPEGKQQDLTLVTDGAGGAIMAWRLGDGENSEGDIYAQKIERNGFLGFPSPSITVVEDYPDDQGGMAVVSWFPSYLDAYPDQVVTDYSIWRRMPEEEPPERGGVDTLTLSEDVGLPAEVVCSYLRSGWSYVGDVTASYWWQYAYDAPTYGDSTASGIPMTEYMVVAQTNDQWVFWESYPFAGYSVDNLAPGAPLALAAAPEQADVELTWSGSGHDDEDLDFYNIYRSDVSGFTPGAGTFIGTAADTLYTDVEPGGGTWYYLVAAEDVHGNEGDASNEASAETWTGVEEPIPIVYALRGNSPNPFNPVTSIHYDVPAPGGRVGLRIYDVNGRLTRELVDEFQGPGRMRVVWRGIDDAGEPVSSGVYFCRMTAAGYEKTIKLTLLK